MEIEQQIEASLAGIRRDMALEGGSVRLVDPAPAIEEGTRDAEGFQGPTQ
jgi:hypothetical protein